MILERGFHSKVGKQISKLTVFTQWSELVLELCFWLHECEYCVTVGVHTYMGEYMKMHVSVYM